METLKDYKCAQAKKIEGAIKSGKPQTVVIDIPQRTLGHRLIEVEVNGHADLVRRLTKDNSNGTKNYNNLRTKREV